MPTRDEPTGQKPTERIAFPALIAGALAAVYALALVVKSHGDISRLVHAAPPWTDPAKAAPSLTVGAAGTGFDGQFFYRLAAAPMSSAASAAGVTFDLPALRAVRWGYGALTWLLSAGQIGAVPWMLLIVNVLAMTANGGIGGALARDLGRPAATGIVFAGWPGFAYSLSLDTSELLAGAFLLSGLLAVRRATAVLPADGSSRLRCRRLTWQAAGLLSLAVVTRETTAVAAVALTAAGVWSRRGVRARGPHPGADHEPSPEGSADSPPDRYFPALVAGAAATAVFIGWQLLTWARFGALPLTSSAGNNITVPLIEMLRAFRAAAPPHGSAAVLRLISMLVVVSLIVVPAIELRRSSAGPAEKLGWALGAVVVLLLAGPVWAGATSFMRGATEMGLFAVLILIGSRSRLASMTVVLPVALWVITALAQLTKLGPG